MTGICPALPLLAHRPMTTADLDAVLAVETVAYGFPWTRGNFADALASGYDAELCTGADEAIVAYRVAMTVADELHLLNLTVRPDLQRRGHASTVLRRLGRQARARGLHSLWLEVRPSNAAARALYARFGLREVGLRRGYYPAGMGRREDAIVMSGRLDAMTAGTSDGLD